MIGGSARTVSGDAPGLRLALGPDLTPGPLAGIEGTEVRRPPRCRLPAMPPLSPWEAPGCTPALRTAPRPSARPRGPWANTDRVSRPLRPPTVDRPRAARPAAAEQ